MWPLAYKICSSKKYLNSIGSLYEWLKMIYFSICFTGFIGKKIFEFGKEMFQLRIIIIRKK